MGFPTECGPDRIDGDQAQCGPVVDDPDGIGVGRQQGRDDVGQRGVGRHRRPVHRIRSRGGRPVHRLLGGEEVEAAQRAAGADEVGHERRGRSGQDLRRSAVLLEPATRCQHRQAVPEPQCLVDVMRHDHHRSSQPALETEELVLEPGPGDRVDGAEGLVHQDDRWVCGQRPGHADPLLLPTGQLVGSAVAVRLRVEPDKVEQLVDAQIDPPPIPAQQPRDRGHVGGHVEVREEPDLLDDVADPPPQRHRIGRGYVFSVDQHPAPDIATGERRASHRAGSSARRGSSIVPPLPSAASGSAFGPRPQTATGCCDSGRPAAIRAWSGDASSPMSTTTAAW